MPAPRVLILRAPGTNCDQETAFAFTQAGAQAEVAHVNRLKEQPRQIDQFQILCLPGGFSYGDDIAAGRIFATQIQLHLQQALHQFKDQGKLILGICNGFQALLKSGLLLPDESDSGVAATLTWNDTGRYEDRWVHLQQSSSTCALLRGVERMYLPIAHAEGKFIARDEATLDQLESHGCLALRYRSPLTNGTPATTPLPFPWNPNGSQRNVAGLCDASGRVFGMMPHPERHIDRTHHPRWTRGDTRHEPNGRPIFENAVSYFQ